MRYKCYLLSLSTLSQILNPPPVFVPSWLLCRRIHVFLSFASRLLYSLMHRLTKFSVLTCKLSLFVAVVMLQPPPQHVDPGGLLVRLSVDVLFRKPSFTAHSWRVRPPSWIQSSWIR